MTDPADEPVEPATDDPAADFAEAMAGLLPPRPADPEPADEPVPADVIDELRRLDADYAFTVRLDLPGDDPAEPDGPRRPRPDPSQGSGAFGGTRPAADAAADFARIITGGIPSGPNPYPTYDPRSTS